MLIFLYLAAYLTGVSALLSRVAPGNPVAVQAVCGILLVFYSLDVGRSPKTRNHTQATLYIEEL